MTILLFVVASPAALATGNIIQITRALRMSQAEALPPKDFYVDMGTRDGLKEGDVLEVYRLIPVTNALIGAPYHLMKIVLGEIRILTVGEQTSIGRIHRQKDPLELPALETAGFMLGDQVQINSRSSLPFR